MHFTHYTDRKKYWCPIEPHENRFEEIPDTFYNSRKLKPNDVLMKKSKHSLS